MGNGIKKGSQIKKPGDFSKKLWSNVKRSKFKVLKKKLNSYITTYNYTIDISPGRHSPDPTPK